MSQRDIDMNFRSCNKLLLYLLYNLIKNVNLNRYIFIQKKIIYFVSYLIEIIIFK